MKKTIIPLITITALCGGLFIWIKSPSQQPQPSNTIVVGTNATFPPFSYLEHDQITGCDIELITTIAHKLGKTVSIKDMNFDSVLVEAQTGRVDVIAAGISPTPERAKQVYFTTPHIKNDPFVIITLKTAAAPKTITDLRGKEVVVNEGFTAESYMDKQPNIKLLRLATVAEAFLAITSGRGEAFISARSAVQPFFDKHGIDKFNLLILEDGDSYAFAVSKKFPKLYEQIQQELKTMEENGELTKLKQKWHVNF